MCVCVCVCGRQPRCVEVAPLVEWVCYGHSDTDTAPSGESYCGEGSSGIEKGSEHRLRRQGEGETEGGPTGQQREGNATHIPLTSPYRQGERTRHLRVSPLPGRRSECEVGRTWLGTVGPVSGPTTTLGVEGRVPPPCTPPRSSCRPVDVSTPR